MSAAQPSSGPSLRRYLDHPRGGPTVLRIVLGTQLRRLREGAGITREAAGDAIRGSHAKISRLELGRVSCKERDVADLLTLYNVTDEAVRADFLKLARRTSSPGWWHQYGDVLPGWFETHIGLEEAASVIRTYEVQFVPGLLQTPDYARAVAQLGHPRSSPEEIERRVQLRVQRQELLTIPDAPRVWAVIDEASLRRPLGGPEVMADQLRHLLKMTKLPNVTLQIAPFSLGGLAAAGGPITILRFLEPDLPDIVYLEQLTSALYLDKRDDVDHYLAVMDRLSAQSESPRESVAILERLLKQES
ncbi:MULTISPECIES: helix-turn-helix domain-containing protein [Streptomyces]|uniref:Helix-turn-helix domain-containing protein n=2 Tax=Streptomyces nigrescens TaxID=1920 RepID=A0A640TEP1_STRNI|nr:MULTISPECIES: helix-turn-helix transcriptional regulator [Streptomyces]MCW7987249.1 XRE family transcriptional regulator [Streptomyces platensis subsp. clarensis]MCX5447002.1 helix-turn-helix transcriptional regulator [Streptomyces libani]WAT95697.1 helix-turn-helix domain-containing protein [Streptomyces libani subsp. libani]WAU03320.1 helix-turn-helix domain-containing protein [Streptomyces nigrescens]WDT58684.1 helix-turn-helix domain-containing protein [Streptomyces sp. G7(2002)]